MSTMFGYNQMPVPPAFFEGFDRDKESPPALNDFQSALIVAYEQALEEGISRSAALAAMLDLAAVELKRCRRLVG